MVRVALVGFFVAVLALVCTPDGRASLHHPDEPFAIPMNAKGEPEALEFSSFKNRRSNLINAADPKFLLDDPDPRQGRTIRGRMKDRIERLQKLPNRTEQDSVILAVDLLRFGRVTEADEPLRNLRRGYLPNMTLAHIAALQNDWGRADTFLDIALDEPPPKQFPGLKPQELAWQIKLNNGPLKKLFRLRLTEAKLAESKGKKSLPPEDELPDAIFGVNFVNAAGVYEPGVLAPAEAAKLPPDAIAIVQQLALWFPHDARLYWLLGELYAAKGEFAAADKIMDDCAWSLLYGNRKALMQHREAVAKAAKAKGPAPDEVLIGPPPATVPAPVETPPAVPFSFGAIWIYFGVVAAIALFAFVRAVTKKRKGA